MQAVSSASRLAVKVIDHPVTIIVEYYFNHRNVLRNFSEALFCQPSFPASNYSNRVAMGAKSAAKKRWTATANVRVVMLIGKYFYFFLTFDRASNAIRALRKGDPSTGNILLNSETLLQLCQQALPRQNRFHPDVDDQRGIFFVNFSFCMYDPLVARCNSWVRKSNTVDLDPSPNQIRLQYKILFSCKLNFNEALGGSQPPRYGCGFTLTFGPEPRSTSPSCIHLTFSLGV